MIAISANAALALKVKSGNWLSILNENAISFVEFDYSNAKWEEGQSYEKFCGDTYLPRVQASVSDFIVSFNELSTGLKMSDKSEDAKYKMVFHIDNLERKQGMSMWGRFFIRIYGQIEIIDNSTNECVCTIAVNGHSGGDDFVPEDRLSKCFRALADKLIKLKK